MHCDLLSTVPGGCITRCSSAAQLRVMIVPTIECTVCVPLIVTQYISYSTLPQLGMLAMWMYGERWCTFHDGGASSLHEPIHACRQ
jgi:hypothetical protein